MAYAAVGSALPGTDLSDEVLDAVGAAIIALDREGHVVRCNQAAARLTGISREEISAPDVGQKVIYSGDIPLWKIGIARAFGGLFSRRVEIRWNRPDGSAIPLVCSFAPIIDENGEIGSVVCTAIRGYSGELMRDRALELHDIGGFLHDTISQELVVLSYTLIRLELLSRGLPGHEEAVTALETAGRCCRDIRVAGAMLVAPLAADHGLEASIEHAADHLRGEPGLPLVLDMDPVSDVLPADARLLLFTAFQHWVARSIRYRSKQELTVRLRERSNRVVFELETPAPGPPATESTGCRWSVIRQRAQALGGDFDIRRDGAAERVRLTFPVGQASGGDT
ncbi:MAG TPA: PAS domain-containing protein [Bryobacteraceae bacterium]|nr:PAS domain-containing protein [Bryobacteraceae bacterium]